MIEFKADPEQVHIAPNTEAWLEWRKNFRTASEAAIVLGISPFTTPEKFKLIKAGLVKQYYNKAMADGHKNEDSIREWANEQFGRDFKEAMFERGRYAASLDGLDGTTLIEIKYSAYTYNDLMAGDVPEYYNAQIQQQLFCSGAEVGYLVARHPKTQETTMSSPIEPDLDYMSKIHEAWERFDAMPVPEGDLVLDDDLDLLVLFERYATLKAEADHLKDEMAAIKDKLTDYAPERTVACRGHKIVYKSGANRTDYRAACKDARLDLGPYTKQGDPSYAITLAKSPFEAEK